ncbi:MAG: ATP-binding cassette domain-containing protein [Dysgonamonadaceae bacterium]|jgi:ABC-2 type transport system ATP-binding protein|nr:ATP-binding cassette domain-containing protein [Dysgonamonadaceae bacterium]
MITINGLTVNYTKDKNVINSLNCVFQANAIHGIVGLNGSGKTTLFNAIFGLKKATHGSVLYNDQPLTKKDTSFLPSENFFYFNITGNEYLSLFVNPTFDTMQWNKLFNLPLNGIIDNYSTGMKKKLALLGIIKQDKSIILLDEPFSGLDIEMCRILRLIILKLKANGKTFIVSSHIMETLTNMCDYIHYLQDGIIKRSVAKDGFISLEQEIFSLKDHEITMKINSLL